jgi:hypothetical protein
VQSYVVIRSAWVPTPVSLLMDPSPLELSLMGRAAGQDRSFRLGLERLGKAWYMQVKERSLLPVQSIRCRFTPLTFNKQIYRRHQAFEVMDIPRKIRLRASYEFT